MHHLLNQHNDQKATTTWHAGYAYTKIIEAAKAEQGELILVVLGPLTNVALACKLDPQLPSRGKLHNVMGCYKPGKRGAWQ